MISPYSKTALVTFRDSYFRNVDEKGNSYRRGKNISSFTSSYKSALRDYIAIGNICYDCLALWILSYKHFDIGKYSFVFGMNFSIYISVAIPNMDNMIESILLSVWYSKSEAPEFVNW